MLLGGILGLLFGALGGFLGQRLAVVLREGLPTLPRPTIAATGPLTVQEDY